MNFGNIKTPAYIIDEDALRKNLEKLRLVKEKSGAKILLAQKAFSMFYCYKLIKQYLDGTTASSLHEAKLGYEEMGGETHIFSPAYTAAEFDEISSICGHIVFNSFAQWEKFKPVLNGKDVSAGVRINPEYSEIEKDIYNPCVLGSRLGVMADEFFRHDWEGIEGLHFHTLCEQNSDALAHTIPHIEEKFGNYLPKIKWLNMGGGHHITRDDYDIDTLVEVVKYMQNKYDLQVYLEPGEAVALNAGYLVSEVVDIVKNGMSICILDTSAACHMPDVIEMPYRPNIIGAGLNGEKQYTYRLGGPTCLAGDIIGDYSFDHELAIGEKIVFCDMAIYSMVKNNTFNGINLPAIGTYSKANGVKIIKEFGYEDFKNRLS
ncbi:MAG: carboxynorspermidine decarboxylase [Clostridia bacterium]|nr:carboxynorspermidine decarboxylase [Clostridia bacterium]